MTQVHCESETPNDFPQVLHVRAHTFRADVEAEAGGHDEAPSAHDYFDASLAACKSLTAVWYAKRNGIPLERVESQVERDATEERKGRYVLRVRLTFHGPLTDEQKKRLYDAVSRCPVHKLMTTTEIAIETAPL